MVARRGRGWPDNQPGTSAHKAVLDTAGGYLYLATRDTGGPYDGGKGDVWKYNTATGAWTQISPIPSSSSDDYFGYSGLTIDRTNPNTIMVATQVSWWPDVIFFRSTDGGATWTRIWDFTSYPNRSTRYTMDISSVPWLTLGANPQSPEQTPKLGWMTESLEIDPFDGNRFFYGTGATLYGATNLRNWDSGGTVTIRPMVKGQIWNATDVQSGAMVTAHNETYNATIAPVATVTFGFLANWTSANTAPTAFALNGSPCSG
jgi:xyloglucan-specific exo-beta-1,4-glucanase